MFSLPVCFLLPELILPLWVPLLPEQPPVHLLPLLFLPEQESLHRPVLVQARCIPAPVQVPVQVPALHIPVPAPVREPVLHKPVLHKPPAELPHMPEPLPRHPVFRFLLRPQEPKVPANSSTACLQPLLLLTNV